MERTTVLNDKEQVLSVMETGSANNSLVMLYQLNFRFGWEIYDKNTLQDERLQLILEQLQDDGIVKHRDRNMWLVQPKGVLLVRSAKDRAEKRFNDSILHDVR